MDSDQKLYWLATNWNASTEKYEWQAAKENKGAATDLAPALAVRSSNTDMMCVFRGVGDNQLYYVWFHETRGWQTAAKIPGAFSESAPALAHSNNSYYCVYRGTDDKIHFTYISADDSYVKTWSPVAALPTHSTGAAPGLTGRRTADANDSLMCVYRGTGTDTQLRWTTLEWDEKEDAYVWSSEQKIPGCTSATGPSVTYPEDYRQIHKQFFCVHRGSG